MSNLNGMWTISLNGQDFNEYEYFDSKEEAINFGREYDDFEGKDFYIGKIESIPMRCSRLGIQLIEMIQEDHYSNDGEYAENYLNDVKREHIDELDLLLEEVVSSWAKKHNYEPSHFFVRNIEKIEV